MYIKDLKSDFNTLDTSRSAFLAYWEIDSFMRCPVVGSCTTLEEQKQILKKAGTSSKDKSPYELHEIMVMSAESENRISRLTQKLLERKYGKTAVTLLELDDRAFKAHFEGALKDGDYTASLWAAAIHPRLAGSVKCWVYGEVHMAMHMNGQQEFKLKKEAARHLETIAELRWKNKEIAQFIKSLKKENQRLQKANEQLTAAFAMSEKEKNLMSDKISHLKDAQSGTEVLIAEEADAHYIKAIRQQDKKLETANRKLAAQAWQSEAMAQQYRQETCKIVRIAAMENCDPGCPSFDLCRKRVLIVGGITKIKAHYRELIEGNNGIFDYHDGYMKNGTRQLESRLRRADVVLCPINCNSHGACSIIKNLAKKHNKTVHMLPSSSLSSVTQVIRGTTGQRGTINSALLHMKTGSNPVKQIKK